MKDITQDEWGRFEWIPVGDNVYIKGVEKTDPPDDGFVYVDVTRYGDSVQRWERAQMYD